VKFVVYIYPIDRPFNTFIPLTFCSLPCLGISLYVLIMLLSWFLVCTLCFKVTARNRFRGFYLRATCVYEMN